VLKLFRMFVDGMKCGIASVADAEQPGFHMRRIVS
jgi:hypothetical protein